MVARFDDGTQATGDLLVGADGVHSVTRRLIDPAAPDGRYVGLVNFGGYTPEVAAGAEPGVWHMIFGRRAFFGYVVDPDGGTVWFVNAPRAKVSQAERAATTAEQWRRQLVELFADDHGPASGLVADGTLQLARDLLLPVVFRFLVTDRSRAWIHDHHIDWDTPAVSRR